jgi:O-antigen ligase
MVAEQAVLAPRSRRQRASQAVIDVLIALVVGAVAIVAIIFLPPIVAGGILLVAGALFLLRRLVFNWTTMLFLLAAVILFIPIRRYALPISVGFELEPYRVAIAVLIVAVAIALANKRTFPWQPVLWGWPIAIFLWTQLASLMFNIIYLTETGLVTAGFSNIFQLAFLLSTVVIFRQLLRREIVVIAFLNFIVYAGAIIGFFAFVERVTRQNVFLQLQNFLPLVLLRDDAESVRAGGNRAFASSQHPIALSVLFCLIIPIAIYLMKYSPWPRFAFTRKLVYSACIGVMLVGLLSAVSRTGIVVAGVMFVLCLLLRPKLALTIGAIALPIVIIVALILPDLFASTVGTLLDPAALIAGQFSSVGLPGQGRLADLPEALTQVAQHPWTGSGIGSRIVVGENANSQILDNQWLGSLLETGVLGILGLAALLGWPAIAMLRFAFTSNAPDSRKFLAFAVATSTVGYITSMFFYDAFAFMQTLLMLSILYAVAAWAMTDGAENWKAVTPRIPEPRKELASA